MHALPSTGGALLRPSAFNIAGHIAALFPERYRIKMGPDELLARGDAPIKAAFLVTASQDTQPPERSEAPVKPATSKKQARKVRLVNPNKYLCKSFQNCLDSVRARSLQ